MTGVFVISEAENAHISLATHAMRAMRTRIVCVDKVLAISDLLDSYKVSEMDTVCPMCLRDPISENTQICSTCSILSMVQFIRRRHPVFSDYIHQNEATAATATAVATS